MLAQLYKKVVALDKGEPLKISPLANYKHAQGVKTTMLAYTEVPEACKHYPIYFGKDDEGVMPLAVLGVKDANLFVDEKGLWAKDTYIPAAFRAYPFGMAQVEGTEDGKYTVIYDGEHQGVKKDAQDVIDDKGELTEFGQQAIDFLQTLQGDLNRTKQALKILDEYELLKFANVDITVGEEKYQLSYVGTIDKEKLDALEDDKIAKLVRDGIYRLIEAHFISSNNLNHMLQRL